MIKVKGKLQLHNSGKKTKYYERSGMKVYVTPLRKGPRPAELLAASGGNTEWVVEEGESPSMSMSAKPLPLRTTNYSILPREHCNCSNSQPQTFPYRVKSHEIPPNHEFAPFSGIEVPQITTLENSIPKKHYTNPVFCSVIYCFSSKQRQAPLRLFSPSKPMCDVCCAVLLCDIP